MNSSRRWLIIFTVAIGILVISTVSLVLLTGKNEVDLLPADTSQGIVQRYLLALQEKNYQKAFGYLSFEPSQKIQTYDDWLRMTGEPYIYSKTAWKATLGRITQNGDNASVEVAIDTFHPGGPFQDPMRSQEITFQLSKINGKWLIISPTHVYWIY
jgi:hypothetical protein